MPPFKVIIVGAGLSGALLANGLVNHGVDVAIYERSERHTKKDGYQIRLGESALMGMRACLTKDQLESTVAKFGRANGKKSSAPVVRDKNFNVLLDLNALPFYEKSAPIGRGVLRDLFGDPLYDAGHLSYEKAFSRYEILNQGTGHERVRVWLADGSHDDCDILVGADGANSKVNTQIGLDNMRTITDVWSLLTKSELPTSKFRALTRELIATPLGICANDRTMFFAAYLPDKFIEGEDSTKYDEDISSLFLGISFPTNELPDAYFKMSNNEKWDLIEKDYSERLGSKYTPIFALLRGCDIYTHHPRVSSRPPTDWREKVKSAQDPGKGHSRVLLLGDAMHAMLPSRGMGGNQSMRDASVLLPLLVDMAKGSTDENLGSSDADADTLCKEYEAEMIPRAFGWVETSNNSMIPDSETWSGRLYLRALSFGLQCFAMYYHVTGYFIARQEENQAPELKT